MFVTFRTNAISVVDTLSRHCSEVDSTLFWYFLYNTSTFHGYEQIQLVLCFSAHRHIAHKILNLFVLQCGPEQS